MSLLEEGISRKAFLKVTSENNQTPLPPALPPQCPVVPAVLRSDLQTLPVAQALRL